MTTVIVCGGAGNELLHLRDIIQAEQPPGMKILVVDDMEPPRSLLEEMERLTSMETSFSKLSGVPWQQICYSGNGKGRRRGQRRSREDRW